MKILQLRKVVITSLLVFIMTFGFVLTNNNTVFASDVHKGVALKSPTNIYSETSRNSTVVKSYSGGSVLIYRTHSKDWFSAVVFIKGKKHSGYINKSDVETSIPIQESMMGVGVDNPTAIYSKASTSSKQLKSYAEGSVLYYKTFTSNWYEALVYIKGKATTGYIHKSHVEDIVEEKQPLTGIGLKNPTGIYSKASTNSEILKSYTEGSILYYKTFTNNWYEAMVYIKGKPTVGYIHISDVEGIQKQRNSLNGIGLKSPTRVYSKASNNASILRSYSKGHRLLFRTFSPNWYEATVILKGIPTTGYIHRDDVSTEKIITDITKYPTNFKSVVDIQMTKAPQVSGKSGGWVNASKEQVEYYVNSSNFNKDSTEYYQFLNLAQPAGLHAKEVNNKILNNHGTLTGKAQSFIDAGKRFNVNEAYLISHALLETGNGKSVLASGVPVDDNGNVVALEEAVYTVYNMYGIGAIDTCPMDCGAKRAFDEGWFKPEYAIVGGAEFINNYVKRGQDTLYKMRWNPISPGYPQYASDVGWATKQTSNISKIYKLLNNFILTYDVPEYAGQPSKSGDPNHYDKNPSPGKVVNYPHGIYGVTETPNNLNLRQGPSTSTDIVGSIPSRSKVEVMATNGTWYNIEFEGKIGWVHGDYVTISNLLEVSVGKSTLNIRSELNASGESYGAVKTGVLLAANLDKDNKIIRSKEWYQITHNDKLAWISGGKNGTEYIKIK